MYYMVVAMLSKVIVAKLCRDLGIIKSEHSTESLYTSCAWNNKVCTLRWSEYHNSHFSSLRCQPVLVPG